MWFSNSSFAASFILTVLTRILNDSVISKSFPHWYWLLDIPYYTTGFTVIVYPYYMYIISWYKKLELTPKPIHPPTQTHSSKPTQTRQTHNPHLNPTTLPPPATHAHCAPSHSSTYLSNYAQTQPLNPSLKHSAQNYWETGRKRRLAGVAIIWTKVQRLKLERGSL